MRYLDLSKRHQKTVDAICNLPTRADVNWSRIESLFSALDGTKKTKKGSARVIVLPNARPFTYHEPHGKHTPKGLLVRVREWVELNVTFPDA